MNKRPWKKSKVLDAHLWDENHPYASAGGYLTLGCFFTGIMGAPLVAATVFVPGIVLIGAGAAISALANRERQPKQVSKPIQVEPVVPRCSATPQEIAAQRQKEYDAILQTHRRELEAIECLPVDEQTRADLKTRSERNLLRRVEPYLQ